MKNSSTSPNKRLSCIDSLRFILSVIIVYFHLLHSSMKPYIGNTEIFATLARKAGGAGLIVEVFLIIAGFFIYRVYRKQTTGLKDFAISRIVRLWPVMAFYTLVVGFLTRFHSEQIILDLCFLRCTGISLSYWGIIWYIGPFFWCSLLIFALLRSFKYRHALLTIAILTYFGYAANINTFNGGLSRGVEYGFLSMGMLRVMGGLGVGVIVAALSESYAQHKRHLNSVKQFVTSKIVWTIVEVALTTTLMWQFVGKKLFKNGITTVILAAALLFLLVESKGYLSRILSVRWLSHAGRYSYSIYVMQQAAFYVLAKTFWKQTDFLTSYPVTSIIISTLLSVGIGVATYYLVEAPATALYQRMVKRD